MCVAFNLVCTLTAHLNFYYSSPFLNCSCASMFFKTITGDILGRTPQIAICLLHPNWLGRELYACQSEVMLELHMYFIWAFLKKKNSNAICIDHRIKHGRLGLWLVCTWDCQLSWTVAPEQMGPRAQLPLQRAVRGFHRVLNFVSKWFYAQ